MRPTNFNQLKNYLEEGMVLTLVDTSLSGHKWLGIPRTIIKKQTNAIKFDGGSWLGLGSTGEKAHQFEFLPNGFIQYMEWNGERSGFLKYEYGGLDK